MERGTILISRLSATRMIFALMLIALSAVSYVPAPDQLSLQLFLLAYGVFFINWFFASGWWRRLSWLAIFTSIVLLIIILINFFVAISQSITVERWVRSFIPILFFVTLAFAPYYVRVLGPVIVLRYLLLSCFTYCLFLLLFNHDAFYLFFNLGGRLTFYLQDSVVPYPFMGVIIASVMPGMRTFTKCMLVVFFVSFVVAVGYKLQIIFLFGYFVWLSFVSPGMLRRVFIVLGLLFGLILMYFLAGEYIGQRMSSLGGGGDEVRLLEIKYALSVFLDNPVFGGGLGVGVPLDQTRPSYSEIKDLWQADSVSYIHNFPFYLLMVGGVSFFMPFLMVVVSSGVLNVRNYASPSSVVKAVVWGALGLFTFFSTSAAHKQVQCIVMLSIFISIYWEANKAKVVHV